MICTKCGKKIYEDEVGVEIKGSMLYNVYIDDRGSLSWEQNEFEDGGEMEIYHNEGLCGAKIADYDEDLLKKIIKEGK